MIDPRYQGPETNLHKTEQYLINRTTYEWRKCKYLGSILDTNEDIKWRQFLAISAANKIQAILLVCGIPRTPREASMNLAKYNKIESQKI